MALAVLAGAAAVQAQDATPPGPVTDDQVNAVAKQLYCPVCENVPLDVCPTVACAQWRATIREKLEAGWSVQQILDYFAAQYGERVLARPPARGLGLLIWVLPPVIVLAGAVVVWQFLRGQTRAASAAAARTPAPPPEDEYAAQIEAELKERW
jgi:cytochrome c-type biogenesis protein CcmH